MSVHSLQLSESCIFPCRTIGIPKECCRNIVARSPFHRHPAFSAFDRRSQYTNPKHITASMNMNIDDTFPRGSLAFGLRALPAHYTSSSWKPMSSAASSTSMRLLKTHRSRIHPSSNMSEARGRRPSSLTSCPDAGAMLTLPSLP